MHFTHKPWAQASEAAHTGSALPQNGQGTGARGSAEAGEESVLVLLQGFRPLHPLQPIR